MLLILVQNTFLTYTAILSTAPQTSWHSVWDIELRGEL